MAAGIMRLSFHSAVPAASPASLVSLLSLPVAVSGPLNLSRLSILSSSGSWRISVCCLGLEHRHHSSHLFGLVGQRDQLLNRAPGMTWFSGKV